jgi:3-methyladenine DNA glycosylase Tag
MALPLRSEDNRNSGMISINYMEPRQQFYNLSLSQYLGAMAMSHAVFAAGISWRVVEAKWPGIEKAFKNFGCGGKI